MLTKLIIVLTVLLLSGSAVAGNLAPKEVAVAEGKNTAYMAGTGALACGAANFGANLLGLDNKWATIGSMLVGNAAIIALRRPDKERGNVDTTSSVVGCTLGSGAVGAGVAVYEGYKSDTKELQADLLRDTREVQIQNKAIRKMVEEHDVILKSIKANLEETKYKQQSHKKGLNLKKTTK